MLKINSRPFISIIIPTYNEEVFIHGLFEALNKQTYPRERFELILADNGSKDKTKEIASVYADQIIVIPEVNVAAVRNAGAAQAKGDLLAFLDADCVPDKTWLEKSALAFIEGEIAFGNKVKVAKDSGWIACAWFSQKNETIRNTEYINSANFFVTKEIFDIVGGFDESLMSGEDWDICQRIKKAGHVVRLRPEINVIHLKNPKSLLSFMKREMWHGIGGLQSFRTNLFDKPLWATFIFIIATFIQIIGLILGFTYFYCGTSAIFLLLFFSSLNKISRFKNFNFFFLIFFLYYFYFLGRAGSVFLFFIRALNSKLISPLSSRIYDATAYILAGFIIRWRPERLSGLRILCYHSISNLSKGGLYPSSNVLMKNFIKQMQFLKKNNFNPISFSELENYLDGIIDLPPKSFFVTFDDGFKNVKNNALPILQDLGFSCIIFIPVDYIEYSKPFPFVGWKFFGGQHKEKSFDNLGYNFLPLTQSDISELSEMKNVLIGSHGSKHKPYPNLSQSEKEKELVESRKILENISGYSIKHFAYPYGAYDRPSLTAACKVYSYVYSVKKGLVQKGVTISGRPINRHSINERHTLANFRAQIYGGYDPLLKIAEHLNNLLSKYNYFYFAKNKSY